MIFDDRIFGDLTKRDFLSQRNENNLKKPILDRIIPEDPTPEEEIKATFICPSSFIPKSAKLHINNSSKTKILKINESKILWEDDIFNFVQLVEIIIPPLKEPSLIRLQLEDVFNNLSDIYSFSVDNFTPPSWIDESIIYHVFIDRFANGEKSVTYSNNLKNKLGGNLKGIIYHLNYIEDLGINAIWISPIFKATSYHGYDVEDYFDIDPTWGTKEDLKRLVIEAFNRGIRIILDFVPNHLSSSNLIFQEALKDESSKYRNWFIFKGNEYETFFGVKSMPKINLKNEEARKYVISVAEYWIKEFGISGYRLDHVTGPDINFWTDYYYSLKSKFPNTFHFGEIVDTPKEVKNYIGKLDGSLDFYLFKIIRDFFIGKRWTPHEFLKMIDMKNKFYNAKIKTLSFLENHDSNRFLWLSKDKRMLRLASIFQFSLNDIPIIYNGQEMGANQFRDILDGEKTLHEYVRLPIPWEEQDKDLIDFYKRLIKIRKNHPSLYKGTFIPVFSSLVSFKKKYLDETILIVINLNENKELFNLDGVYKDLFNEKIYSGILEVEPMAGYLLLQINH